MSQLTIAGGVYVESCLAPPSTVLLGSAGRAAMALAHLSSRIVLHTFHPAQDGDDVVAAFSPLKIQTIVHPSRTRLTFDYLHPLSRPRLSPIPIPWAGTVHVEDECVLRFGCLEGDFRVTAKRAVYDPQSGTCPSRFPENGSAAEELALVLNLGELQVLGRSDGIEQSVETVLQENAASVVVVKAGPDGAMVFDRGMSVEHVPAFAAESIYKIGSGDVFSAAFAHYWLQAQMRPAEAAHLASLQTARYVETRVLPCPERIEERERMPRVPIGARRIYLAAPFFNAPQLWLVEEARSALIDLGLKVFSPYHDVGLGPPVAVAPADIQGLEGCDAVLALLADADAGTLFECGVAHAKGKPVVAYMEANRPQDPTMLVGLGAVVVDDFATALHKIAWMAQC